MFRLGQAQGILCVVGFTGPTKNLKNQYQTQIRETEERRKKKSGLTVETVTERERDRQRKMKLTWKNKRKDNKKRSLGAVSIYPNLPFDHQDDDADTAYLKDGDDDKFGFATQQDPPQILAAREPSESSEAKQLAESFQAQGNKLAEVPTKKKKLKKKKFIIVFVICG